ncbi:MAG: peroxiredoxin family protein [Candidatus Tectomicrobia bacterium]|nr:peroxiredoxin family protein [Candidatus Tectomicrobia bacterium]
MQLGELQKHLQQFQAAGAELITVSTDDAATAEETVRRLKLSFKVFPDPQRQIVEAYDVLHPQEGIARPSTFIIDKGGIIRWKYIGQIPSDRPNIQLLINLLSWL